MKHKQNEYLPLQIVKDYRQAVGINGVMFEIIRSKSPRLRNCSDEEIIEFIFSDDFMSKDYDGKFIDINQIAKNYQKEIHNIPTIKRRLDTQDWRDFFVLDYCVFKWAEYKQAYKIDADFFKELKCTENVIIPNGFTKYLPVPDIYLDLSEIEDADIATKRHVDGAFVHTINIQGKSQIITSFVAKNNIFGAACSYFSYNKHNCSYLPIGLLPSDFPPFARLYAAIIQILLFLSSDKNDIQENPITKKTYKKPSVIRDKFSEVRIWDVGVRYGKAIRAAKEEAKKEYEKSAGLDHEGTANTVHARKRPRPHVRCAHWHRYHVGKGRTGIRLNWIPPVFVCKSKEIPVVIHNVG